jgi:hypothetical protein
MRTVTTTTDVYKYTELSDEAKVNARQHVYDTMCQTDQMTEEIRYVIMDSLNADGWEGIDPAEGDDADLDRLQFSVSHSQGDFVAFALQKNWKHQGTAYRVKVTMQHQGGGRMSMTADLVDDEGESVYDGSDKMDHAEVDAAIMVRESAQRALDRGHKADLDATDADGYIEGVIEANDYEFLASGQPYN